MRVEREVDVAAAPETIYDIVMDPRRLADWVTIHQRLEDAPKGSLRAGSELTQKLKLAGRGFTVTWRVVENEPAKRVVWTGRGPVHSRAKVIYEFSPNGNGGTRFSYANEYHLPGGPLGRMAGPMVKRITQGELDESLRKLQALAESN
jgi:carbon monoxide dehydrogenase subunit G